MFQILVIDDTEANLLAISASLEHFGYIPTCTTDPIHGFQLAQSQSFDLLIVDLRMPVMDGLSFVQMLRAEELKIGRKPVPLLALTADQRKGMRKTLQKAGANEYMEKPFELGDLRDTVTRLIAEAKRVEA